jgi:hypothetical protein
MLLPITLPCRLARGGEWGRVRGRLEPGRIWGGVIVLCSMRHNAGWGSALFAPRAEQQNKNRNCVRSLRRNGSGGRGGTIEASLFDSCCFADGAQSSCFDHACRALLICAAVCMLEIKSG